jgi:hypothetical protein
VTQAPREHDARDDRDETPEEQLDRNTIELLNELRVAGTGKLSANLTTTRDRKAIEMVHYPNPEDALAAAGVSAPYHGGV